MKKITKALFFTAFIVSGSSTQITKAPLEIFLKTVSASGKIMVFVTTANTTPIWHPTNHLIDTNHWDCPISIQITGNYSDDLKGWDTNATPYNGNPELGCAKRYTVSIQGRSASFTIETYGGSFNGDVYIDYNYADDQFYYRGTGDAVSNLNMYDNPEYLQPMPPRNFTCTNVWNVGQHPYFSWSACI